MSTGQSARPGGGGAARWVGSLFVPALAVALMLSSVAVAQDDDFGGGGDSADCTPLPELSNTRISGGGLDVGPGGDVFVVESAANCVVRIDRAGVGHFVIGGADSSPQCPTCGADIDDIDGVSVAPDGTIYTVDREVGALVAVSPDGTTRTLLGELEADRTFVQSFALDRQGRVLFADFDTVSRLDPSGRIVIAGGGGADVGSGAPATNVRLDSVDAIAAGPDGSVYIAQRRSARVLRVEGGKVTLFAGNGVEGETGDGGPAIDASITPYDLAVDDAGNVYITNAFGSRVRKVDANGVISTFAGTGGSSFSGPIGDGGPASRALLFFPGHLAFADGNLYILDDYRVRKIDSRGIITTLGTPAPPDS